MIAPAGREADCPNCGSSKTRRNNQAAGGTLSRVCSRCGWYWQDGGTITAPKPATAAEAKRETRHAALYGALMACTEALSDCDDFLTEAQLETCKKERNHYLRERNLFLRQRDAARAALAKVLS